MLSQKYPREKLTQLLLPREKWTHFPDINQRDAWSSLPDSVRQTHIVRAEESLGVLWPPLSASVFLQYARNGNRSNFQDLSFERRTRLADLVMAECMENEGRFLDDIVNGVWAICEESYWGVPAHVGVQAAGVGLPDTAEPTVDLFAAETGALLAWTYYLLGEKLNTVSPLVRPRIEREMDTRIFTPCLERDDFWWMGFDIGDHNGVNNWNPWINSNWLTMTLLVEKDPQRRIDAVYKILRSLDLFIDPYPTDGGCDEGPSYWGRAGASLFEDIELLHSASDGAINVYDESLIQEIGRFVYRVQIDGDYYVNFADAPAIVTVPAAIVYRYGKAIGDENMAALGAYELIKRNVADKGVGGTRLESIGRQLATLFHTLPKLLAEEAAQPRLRDVWLNKIEVLTARDEGGSAKGLYVAAKGGHNAESHNHNDIGNFVVYTNGKPAIIDVGVEDYTAKTFGPRRYEIWTMQSQYHSLPTIDGVMQFPGRDATTKDVSCTISDEATTLTLDISPAYPPEANLKSWVRSVTLNRGKDVTVIDSYDLSQPANELTLSLLSVSDVTIDGGTITLSPVSLGDGRESGAAKIFFDADTFAATTEEVAITDRRLQPIWGEKITRILLRVENPPQQDIWTLRVTQ